MAVPAVHLPGDRLRRLTGHSGALAVRTAPAVFAVRGPGAVTCLQGLLSNDVVQPGEGGVVYGAMLTPKGAIVADLWVFRLADGAFLLGDPACRAPLLELFRASLPPRLARVEDRTGELTALWLVGAGAVAATGVASLPLPEAGGRLVSQPGEEGPLLAARPHAQAPFRLVLLGPAQALDRAAGALAAAGVEAGTEEDLEAVRILSGWPRLGFEIGERTLPQEVRYDDIQGVSYTKGCYTGQETVARLHFRGHPNRELRGLVWSGDPAAPVHPTVKQGDREIGTIGSVLQSDRAAIGLALLRREVEPGAEVEAGGKPARVVALPFDLADVVR